MVDLNLKSNYLMYIFIILPKIVWNQTAFSKQRLDIYHNVLVVYEKYKNNNYSTKYFFSNAMGTTFTMSK